MTFQAEVKRGLAGLPLFASGERVLEAAHDGLRLRCDLVALDALACAFTRLAVHSDAQPNMSMDEVRQVAERLAGRLTYLLEPISPIEIDADGCVVQMRSNPPQKEEDRTSYYELLVSRGGELSLSRYSRAQRAVREMIPAHVTREVFLRLVQDFSNALAG
jgi:hypothetical protein